MTFKEIVLLESMTSEDVQLQGLLLIASGNLNSSSLNESSLKNALQNVIDKSGLKIHKTDGLLDYFVSFATGAGKMILAAIRNDKEEIKKLSKEFDKAKMIDFLFKMDMVTLHIVTGPLHIIYAYRDWETDRKSTRLNSSHSGESRMPSSA